MSEGVVYPEVLSLIYLEVATIIGITCQPIRTPLSKNPILICKFKGAVEEFYIDMCKPGGFLDRLSDDPQSDDLPACSFEVFFEPMLKSLVACDKARYLNLWPVKAKVVENVQVCLEVEDLVEDAHRLLQKVARHHWPSIKYVNYTVGRVVLHSCLDAQGIHSSISSRQAHATTWRKPTNFGFACGWRKSSRNSSTHQLRSGLLFPDRID
ncbi:hypothetical protein DAPPUDRAFT_112237 [Daphnia pulex]|uniref:Uncharacterized protein n=1 Tax=Daphnia pulex TaxID=6669 RepID=E9HBC9_DAPPU|nr:hypothetical protein DAPPUDRAFT_112237 [Daphnia pulex]|eukprot:EFX70968.1 hypothetical protein DAPPUDRAFT_112237 [Daphnia pulex]